MQNKTNGCFVENHADSSFNAQGAMFLGEAIERADFFGALVSYIGVMFVTRPAFLFGDQGPSNDAPPLAVICAFGGAFFQACSYIAMRSLKDVHYIIVNHYFLLFGIIYALLTIWYFGVVSAFAIDSSTGTGLDANVNTVHPSCRQSNSRRTPPCSCHSSPAACSRSLGSSS